jgi:hypothetical protein
MARSQAPDWRTHTEVEMDGAAILVDIEIPTRAAREIEYG